MAKSETSRGAGISADHGGVMAPKQSSPPIDVAAGSGSRPGPSRYPIETTAPRDPKGLDGRRTAGALD